MPCLAGGKARIFAIPAFNCTAGHGRMWQKPGGSQGTLTLNPSSQSVFSPLLFLQSFATSFVKAWQQSSGGFNRRRICNTVGIKDKNHREPTANFTVTPCHAMLQDGSLNAFVQGYIHGRLGGIGTFAHIRCSQFVASFSLHELVSSFLRL